MSNLIVDDIARAMTDVEAPANLRARVLSEIGRPHSRRWPAFRLQLAAASIVAVGALAMRPSLTELDVPPVTRPSLVEPTSTDPAPHTLAVTAHSARARRPEAPMSADELAWQSRRVAALETRMLTLEPIQPPAPAIAPISVEPIALEPIAVPPPGSGSGDRR